MANAGLPVQNVLQQRGVVEDQPGGDEPHVGALMISAVIRPSEA